MAFMGPDTIFPHSFNYNWSPRYLYNVEKEQTGSFSCIYTLLHQQGKMLKTEWGDKTKVSSLDILALLKSRAVLTFGNLWVLHLCAWAHCWKMPSVCPVLSQWTRILHRHQQAVYLRPIPVLCCPFSTNL